MQNFIYFQSVSVHGKFFARVIALFLAEETSSLRRMYSVDAARFWDYRQPQQLSIEVKDRWINYKIVTLLFRWGFPKLHEINTVLDIILFIHMGTYCTFRISFLGLIVGRIVGELRRSEFLRSNFICPKDYNGFIQSSPTIRKRVYAITISVAVAFKPGMLSVLVCLYLV